MSTEENKALIRRWYAEIDALHLDIIDELLADGYVDHTPLPLPFLAPGREGVKQVFEMNRAAFTAASHTIEDQVAEGDLVTTRLTGAAMHTGEFLGAKATNKHVTMSGIVMHRVANGKIVEHWSLIDALSLLQQMGLVPAPAQPAEALQPA